MELPEALQEMQRETHGWPFSRTTDNAVLHQCLINGIGRDRMGEGAVTKTWRGGRFLLSVLEELHSPSKE
jgi:hypothetical protein